MAYTDVTVFTPSLNVCSSAWVSAIPSSDGVSIACDDFSKLNVVIYNGSTGSVTGYLIDATSGTDWVATGGGNSTTVTFGSSEWKCWAGIESVRFKSTGSVLLASFDNSSTEYGKIAVYAFQTWI